jgi:hypothetical protein
MNVLHRSAPSKRVIFDLADYRPRGFAFLTKLLEANTIKPTPPEQIVGGASLSLSGTAMGKIIADIQKGDP